jgi:hypothetical protein
MRDFVTARFEMILSAFDTAANSPALKAVKEWAPTLPRPPVTPP